MRDPAIGGNKALVFPPWFPPCLEPEAYRLYANAVGLGFKWKIAMVGRLGLTVTKLSPDDELWQRLWLLRCMYDHDLAKLGGLRSSKDRPSATH